MKIFFIGPAYWKITEWSSCNCGNFNEETYRAREVKCVQELGTGMVIKVNDASCADEAPMTREDCECPKYMKTPQLEVYKHSKLNSHHHTQSELDKIRFNIHGVSKNSTATQKPIIDRNKNTGLWLSAEWNEQCSTECGTGIQHRSIFCERGAPNTDKCDLRITPDTTRQCLSEKKCGGGDWFVGVWTSCSGDCFNLKKTRNIICLKNNEIQPDEECDMADKPQDAEICDPNDVKDCKPKWHYSDWTEVCLVFFFCFLRKALVR